MFESCMHHNKMVQKIISSIPPCVTFKTPLARMATGNHLIKFTSLEKTQSPVLVLIHIRIFKPIGDENLEQSLFFLLCSKSSMLWNSIKILLVRTATENHLIKSTSLEKTQFPFSGLCYAGNRVFRRNIH